MAHDALGAHARDELGISETLSARPIQAALASAGSFAVGAAMPLLVTAIVPEASLIYLVSGTSLVLPRASRRVGCARWGRGRYGGRDSRHVLGRAGDGDHGGRRGALRNGGIGIMAEQVASARSLSAFRSFAKANSSVPEPVVSISLHIVQIQYDRGFSRPYQFVKLVAERRSSCPKARRPFKSTIFFPSCSCWTITSDMLQL